MAVSCNVVKSSQGTIVREDNGEISKLYSDALDSLKDETEALRLWGVARSEDYKSMTQKDSSNSSVNDVLAYLDNIGEGIGGFRLTEQEIANTKMLLNETPFNTFTELYEGLSELFKPKGIAEINEKRLLKSGLYTLKEIQELDLVKINDFINKLGVESTVIDYNAKADKTISNIKDMSKPKNELGMHPFVTEQQVVEYALEHGLESLDDSPYSFVNENARNGVNERVEVFKAKPALKIETVKERLNETLEQEYARIEREAKENGTWLKAPNGNDSNLSERQWVQVRSRAFLNWFGDWLNDPKNASKVVDENGEPLITYHGSKENFTVFNEKQTNNSGYGGYYQDVSFFTDDKKVAENFAGKNGKVYEVFLNIKNPYYRDGRFVSPTTKLEYEDDSNDGIIINNADTGAGIATEYLIDTEEFSPNQIKSATDNVGTFSSESNDIRFQQGRLNPYQKEASKIHWEVYNLGRKLTSYELNNYNKRLKAISDWIGDETWHLRETRNGGYYVAGYQNRGVTFPDYYSPYANGIFRFQIIGEKGAKRLDDFKSRTINMFNLDNANKIQSKELFSEMMDFSLNKLPENLREQVVRYFNNEKIDESTLKEIESNEEYRKAFNSYGLWKSDLNEWDGLSNKEKNDYTKSLTGWEQGKDGKWRMEVSDIEYIGEPFKDMSYNQSDDVVGDDVYKTKLSDLVKGEDVFKSYPELNDVDVVVINNDSKVKDNIRDISFDLLYLNNKIIINEERFRESEQSENLYQQRQRIRGLLIHEIQHIIQNDEGFASGTNVLAEEGRLRKAVGEFKAAGFKRDKISAEGLNVLETAFYTRLSKGESLEDITKNIKDYSDGAKVLYLLSAGEVEARNADLRSNLSEVERASKSIERTEDIPRELQATFKDLFDYVNGSSLQVAGERGATLLDLQEQSTPRLDNLRVAREMENAGESALEIKLATSWERGVDGKWRYEIDYGKSKITDLSALKYKDKLKGVGEGLSVKKLSDYIDNEELFTAYPKAKNIDVIVFDENSKINLVSKDFYLSYQGNYIFINKNNLENARNIRIEEGIRHEIQHYIQSVEKFDRGSSPEGEAIKIQSRIHALRNGYEKIGELTDWRKRYIEDIERISKRELGKSLVENLGDFSEGEIITLSNYVYQDLAGEVEARNVQNRYLNLTKEERAKTLLSETEDVVRESQVILSDELNRLESSNAVGNASELTLYVIDRLKQNGLSDNVFIHNTNELLDKLKELGYDNAVLNEGISDNDNIHPIPNGFVVTENGKKNVYLNSDNLNPNTAIHEFGHLYLESLKQSNIDVYNAGVSLISKNKAEAKEYIDYVNRTQPELKEGSERWNEEVLAQVIGDNGVRLIDRSQKGNSIKNWLSNFWNSIREILGLTDYTASQVSNMTLREFGEAVSLDMMRGRDLGFGLSLDGGINLQTMEVEAMRAEALSMSKDDFIDRYSGAEFRDGHSAPGDSGHEGTLEERMDEGDDFNLSEVVQGFHTQPSDYFGSMGARWYGYDNSYGTQSMNTIRRVSAEIKNQIEEFGEIKDMPTVTIYRAVPVDVNIDRMINGDWVSLSEDYAVSHGESRFGEGGYKVIKEEVPANDVWWDGNDLAEWGYDDGGEITREEAGKLWEEYRATPINSMATGSNIRLQILGERGAEALDKFDNSVNRMDNLEVARRMEASNKSVLEIRLATGWERGADNLWRYEILDGEIKKDALKELEKNQFLSNKDVNIGLVTYRKNDNDTYELSMMEKGAENTNQIALYSNLSEPELVSIIDNKEVSDKVLSGEGSESIIGANLDDAKEIKTDFTTFITGASPLNEVFESKELFTAYPELKDVVVAVDKNEGLGASYSIRGGQKVITVGNVTNRTKSSLIHEIQHAIQDIEGFAKGGSPAIFAQSRNNISKLFKDIENVFDKLGYGDWLINGGKVDTTPNRNFNGMYSFAETQSKSVRDRMVSKLDEANKIINENKSIFGNNSIYDNIKDEELYRILAGEVEARNVQSRMSMTSEQRRQTLLESTEDVNRDSQIIETIGRGRVQSFISLRQLNETNEYGSNVSKIKLSELTDNDNTSNVDLVVFDDSSDLITNDANFDVLVTDNAIFVNKNKIENGNASIFGESWIKKIGDYSEIIRGVNEGFKKGERDKGNNLVNGEEILRTLSNNDNSIRLSRYEKLEELGGVSEGTTKQSLGEDRGGDKIAISLKLPQPVQSITEQVSGLSYSERQNIFNRKLNDVSETSKNEIKDGLQELDFDLREQVANGLNRQAELNKQVEDEIAPFEVEVEPTVSFSKAELGIGLEDKVNSFKAVPKMRTGFNGEITRDNLDTFTTLNNTLLSGIDRNSFLVDYNFLTGISENVWKSNIEDVRVTLKSVERNLIKDNIDLIGLSDLVYNREGVLELLSALNEVISKPTKQNIFNFAALKDELIGIETVDNFFTKDLPLVYKDKTIVRYDGKETLDNLLEKQGMIKIADGLYHKVNLGDLSVATENLKEGIYNKFLKGEFELPSEYLTVNNPYELENKSAVIESITNYANSRDVGVELNNKELYSLIQLNFNHLPIQKANVVNEVPSNAEYLKTGFVSDFYNYMLNEKLADSDLYNKVLKNFKITDNDIVWQGIAEPIIDGIRFEQELRDYASLKREPGMLSSLINKDVQGGAINEDLQALNYPETVKVGLEKYQRIKYSENGEVLLSEFTPDNWVRVGNELYRKVADLVEGSVFEGVNISSDPTYFDTNLNFETNLAAIIKTVENLANKDITSSFDNIDITSFIKTNLRNPNSVSEQSIKQALDNGILIEPISNEVKREYDSCSI